MLCCNIFWMIPPVLLLLFSDNARSCELWVIPVPEISAGLLTGSQSTWRAVKLHVGVLKHLLILQWVSSKPSASVRGDAEAGPASAGRVADNTSPSHWHWLDNRILCNVYWCGFKLWVYEAVCRLTYLQIERKTALRLAYLPGLHRLCALTCSFLISFLRSASYFSFWLALAALWSCREIETEGASKTAGELRFKTMHTQFWREKKNH